MIGFSTLVPPRIGTPITVPVERNAPKLPTSGFSSPRDFEQTHHHRLSSYSVPSTLERSISLRQNTHFISTSIKKKNVSRNTLRCSLHPQAVRSKTQQNFAPNIRTLLNHNNLEANFATLSTPKCLLLLGKGVDDLKLDLSGRICETMPVFNTRSWFARGLRGGRLSVWMLHDMRAKGKIERVKNEASR